MYANTDKMFSDTESDMPLIYKYKSDFSDPWENYCAALKDEYTQCMDEGLDIEKLKSDFGEITRLENGAKKQLLADRLFTRINGLGIRDGYKYVEPNDLDEIKSKRAKPVLPKLEYDKASIGDKIKGAWYGRIAGCLIGKTVEGIRTEELVPFLKQSGNYPMRRYIVSSDLPRDFETRYRFNFKTRCYADKIKCAPADDDTNYTCLYQRLIERYGRSFTSDDVCAVWMTRQPKTAYCTAERVAYLNMVKGLKPPYTATFQNPYREWIGAQIRADYFGYINPGDPETAAEMAFRDAAVSHVKNGIYGEMFVAAMIALAAVEDDILTLINTSLNVIPAKSRLYESVRELLDNYLKGQSEETAFNQIHSLYDEHTGYGWCHTIPNALIVCASLLYSKGDFSKGICRAVQAGFDTDCNGATVGSILGMRGGMGAIDEKWIKPLNGRLETTITGVGEIEIETLVEDTLKHIGI